MDPRRTPKGILPAHLADQISEFAGNERSSGLVRRTFQVQNRRKPARCQATTVPTENFIPAEVVLEDRWCNNVTCSVPPVTSGSY
jgi:hypothetical protein